MSAPAASHGFPPPPRALERSAAARMAWHRAHASVFVWVGAIFLLVGSVFAAVIIPLALRDRALLREGTRSTATVVGKYSFTERDSDGDRVRRYRVQYEFPLADGQTWAAEDDIDRSEWNQVREGEWIEVRYDPDNPDRNLSPRFHDGWLLFFGILFPGIFVMLGALLLRPGLQEVLGPIRLYRIGEAVTGHVDGFETVTNERINRRHPIRIHYHFRDHTGAEREGALKTMDGALLDSLEQGAAVTVLYDPHSPERNTLLAALGVPVRPHPADYARRASAKGNPAAPIHPSSGGPT